MKKFMVTSYRGYSQVIGQISLRTFFEQFRIGVYRRQITDIEKALKEGDLLKADRIKRQLPYFTLTTNYAHCRLPHSLCAYNDLLLLDFDEMASEDLPRLRQLAEADENTIACALSPRRHGLKILVYLRTEEAMQLRAQLRTMNTITYAQLEHYHKQMFEWAHKYYAPLLNSKVDESGSDLSRGMYATYDPDTFFSEQRLANIQPLDIAITLPTPEESTPRKRKSKRYAPVDEDESTAPFNIDLSDIDPLSQLEFRKALEYTRRKFSFEPNSRDSFIYCLGNQCYTRHIAEEAALRMTLREFGSEPDFDAETPLRNAYRYTSKSDTAEEEQKKPIIRKIIEFLDQHYEFRRNTILDRLEYRKKTTGTGLPFTPLRAKDLNTLYTHLQLSAIYCSLTMLKAVVDSNYAADHDPFIDYFLSLPPWDGVTDYIAQLAATVKTDDPEFWVDSLRHWLVGLVASAINDDEQNQLMLLLYSKQGKGKSRFIRSLLPPELRTYYRNGMINPDNKDHMLQLVTCLIINLEEFDGVTYNRLADLKRIITQESVTERKVYDTQAHTYVRHASFAASTNNPHCLLDIGEHRRILFQNIISVNYLQPVNHTGIYSQALALYQSGFRFWYEGDEIDELNTRNENFRLKDPVEENLFFYYRAATPKDYTFKWLPAAAILSTLSVYGRTQSNRQILQTLVTVLDVNGFRKRTTANGITEYAVVEYRPQEREENALRAQQAEEQRKMNFDE